MPNYLLVFFTNDFPLFVVNYITFNVCLRNYRFNVINAVAFVTQRLDNQEISANLSYASACPITFFVRWNSNSCSNAINNQLFNTKETHQSHTEIQPFDPITIYLYKCYLHELYRVPLNRGNARFTQLFKSKVINYNNILNNPIFFAPVKAQWDESGGRVLLGDNTGSRAVMLRPITF